MLLEQPVAQLVAAMSGVVLGGAVEVVGSNLVRAKCLQHLSAQLIYYISLYLSTEFLILCSSKAMMFVNLYFCTSDIYLISLVSLIGSIRLLFAN